ncbi:hypothetical protein KTI63_05070 [Acinetobacter guillouiae]|jgi:hypothetical protein|nr:hypothetical protein [Acinetobacter guillouiae]MCU4491842.1 hypothetical protein [Acinetobacter guillouiae]
MSISKQLLVFICIICAVVLLNLYDGFIAKQTGKTPKQPEFIYLQD